MRPSFVRRPDLLSSLSFVFHDAVVSKINKMYKSEAKSTNQRRDRGSEK